MQSILVGRLLSTAVGNTYVPFMKILAVLFTHCTAVNWTDTFRQCKSNNIQTTVQYKQVSVILETEIFTNFCYEQRPKQMCIITQQSGCVVVQ